MAKSGFSVNIRKRLSLGKTQTTLCEECKIAYDPSKNYCEKCGKKLTKSTVSMWANYGKNGLTSITIKFPNGATYNTKTGTTFSFGNGISYRIK